MLFSSKEYCQKKRFREKEYLEFRCIDISNLLRINPKKCYVTWWAFIADGRILKVGMVRRQKQWVRSLTLLVI